MAERLRRDMPERCELVSLPQIPEPRGNLTALEELVHLPFRIGSVRWFYDLPAGTSWSVSQRGVGDALIVALSGSFDVVVGARRIRLGRASTGLHVPASVGWTVEDPATNSVGLIISSEPTRPHRVRADQADRAASRGLNPHSTIDDCRRIRLPRHRRGRGSTTEVLPKAEIPFDVLRVYYLYDVPGGAERGGHAHRTLEQVLVSLAGSFDVVLKDGRRVKTIRLDRAHSGVFIATGIWRELRNFSSGAICLALASAPYDEADYIREYGDFRREKHG
jgi:dTDP-4-dehydrorhamnose 3,5-epimerase-like enzyme